MESEGAGTACNWVCPPPAVQDAHHATTLQPRNLAEHFPTRGARSVQLSLLLAILLAFFLLTSHGAYVRLGMYGAYFRQYRRERDRGHFRAR